MVKNSIRARLLDKKVSQAALSRQTADAGNDVAMSFITTGRVLPTKRDLDVICKVLGCEPADLYATEDLDLLGSMASAQPDPHHALVVDAIKDMNLDLQTPTNNGRSHIGEVAFRVWCLPEEKKAIEIVSLAMGYRNTTEWFRAAYRSLLHDAMALLAADVPADARPVTADVLPLVLNELSTRPKDTADKE